MEKQLKKYILPICLAGSILLLAMTIVLFVKPMIEDFQTAKEQKESTIRQEQELAKKNELLKLEQEKEEMRLKSIKQIYQSNITTEAENLGVFGTMFEDIIKKVQYNGLLIRSIEYDLKPAFDPIYQNYAEDYNTCELKFFLVGKYSQLQSFLVDLNNTFPYLLTISKMDISAFSGNTDYLIIGLSLTLYSKKGK